MKILVLNGSIGKNSVPLVSMHLSQDFEVVTRPVLNEDLSILKQKYDMWEHIPDSEVMGPLIDAMDVAKDDISSIEPDLIIGVQLGCAVLSNLIVDKVWSGPAVMIDPDGIFYIDETTESKEKVVWFVRKNDKSFVRKNLSKVPSFKIGTTIYVNDENDMNSLHTMSIVKNVVRSLCS